MDPPREENLALADKLRLAGVPLEHHDFAGMVHGFALMTGEFAQEREALGAPQKLTTSTRIDSTTPKTDRATWHGDGRYLPHPRRRRVSR